MVTAGDPGSIPGSGRSSAEWQPTPAFLPGESHGQRSLVGHSPGGRRESETTEQLTLSLSLQRSKIHLPMQGMQVQSLVGELCSHVLQGNKVCAPHLETKCSNQGLARQDEQIKGKESATKMIIQLF